MASPARLDLDLVAGDDEVLEFDLVDDAGAAVDLTGRTYQLQVRSDPKSTTAADCTFTCSMLDPTLGVITAAAAATATHNLTPGDTYYWSLLEYAVGRYQTLITGRVSVAAQVTKD